jgi:hypothetical protein
MARRDYFRFLTLVFLAALVMTIGSALAGTLIAYFSPDPTHNQQEIFDAFKFAMKAGVVAILGLLVPLVRLAGNKKGPARLDRAGQ